jgi:hypothetical protein
MLHIPMLRAVFQATANSKYLIVSECLRDCTRQLKQNCRGEHYDHPQGRKRGHYSIPAYSKWKQKMRVRSAANTMHALGGTGRLEGTGRKREKTFLNYHMDRKHCS